MQVGGVSPPPAPPRLRGERWGRAPPGARVCAGEDGCGGGIASLRALPEVPRTIPWGMRAWGRRVEAAWFGCCLACSGGPRPPEVAVAPAVEPAATVEAAPTAAATPPPPLRTNAEVQRILDDRLGDFAEYYGIVVGLVDAGGRRVISRGHLARGDERAPDGDTLFELGSITKVFTSLLLAISVERGEVGLDDPLVKHLPPGTTAPSVDGRPITLRDLATHTSGLPRVPKNLEPKDPKDPYAEYTVEMMYAYLAGAVLEQKPGTKYSYSNLGAALLARALMVRTNKTYAELVRERITEPLGMSNTWVDVSPERQASLAPGHTQALEPAPYRTRQAMIGNGGIISSANDVLTFLSASSGLVETPLAPAFHTIEAEQLPIGEHGSVGLGWHLLRREAGVVVWHNGGTGGFRTFAAYDRQARQAVVVLANVSTPEGVDDIGVHLIAGGPLLPAGSPDVTPFRPRQQVAVAPPVLDRYVGDYQLAPQAVLSVRRDGGQLNAQLTGQPWYPVFPESERVFFYKVVDAALHFEADAPGHATAVVLHQQGRERRAPRIEPPLVHGEARR
jgi:D-alanyl-D-alanine-carboxypeptidase/D-alanyl-D-alanine-endopeptidase